MSADMFVAGLAVCLLFATGAHAFSATTTTPTLKVPENQGADLTCTYSADFGSSPRVEWKFKDLLGIQTSYVFYDGKPTSQYADRVTQYNGGLRFSKVTRKDTGQYDCTVAGQGQYADAKIQLIVLVPPSPPICRIPLSVTTDRNTLLTCEDPQASPPATYKWYFNNVPLPEDPSKFSSFQNSSYKVNTVTGSLAFPRVSKVDAGEYFCEAINEAGPAQRCAAVRMEVHDLNTGGIAAGIILALLAVALLGFALWFAYRKGYLPKKDNRKSDPGVYRPPPQNNPDEGDGSEFRQKSSFVV